MSDSSGHDYLKMLEKAVQYQPGDHDFMKTETVYADNEPLYTYPVGMFGDIPLNRNWHDAAKYVEEHLPDGEWLVRKDFDVCRCMRHVLIENLTTDFHVRMDINNADWNKMYAIDLVNKVLKQMIDNSPQKIQPIEPSEPKIMKCEVCGGPMEAPYTLCKFCGQTYKIGGTL
jgi:uncharacterized protein (DUF1919 family)